MVLCFWAIDDGLHTSCASS